MGERCTHKYRASREQWKMLTVKEAATQKTQHQHTYVWNSFLFTFLWWVMLGFIISKKLMCSYKYTNTPHRCNFQYSLPSSAKKSFSLPAKYHSPELDQGIADMSGARYWRQEWLQESQHLLQQTQSCLQTTTAQSKTTPWERIENSESLAAGICLVS